MSERPRIDLYSDTQTRPSRAMREAMANAEVGDEQRNEDPTVRELCSMVAELLGKDAALFLPSGTMCNEIAYRTHTRPGDEIILHETSHAMHFEGGAPAALSGVMLRTLPGERGMFTADQVRATVRGNGPHFQRSRLVSVENTTNLGGGAVWSIDALDAVADAAHERGLATHMDGARLMNAVVASGVAASEFARGYDSAWIDMSKGLGAPVGGVLAGSHEFIAQALRHKHQFGGAMRQAGIIAAAGVYRAEAQRRAARRRPRQREAIRAAHRPDRRYRGRPGRHRDQHDLLRCFRHRTHCTGGLGTVAGARRAHRPFRPAPDARRHSPGRRHRGGRGSGAGAAGGGRPGLSPISHRFQARPTYPTRRSSGRSELRAFRATNQPAMIVMDTNGMCRSLSYITYCYNAKSFLL